MLKKPEFIVSQNVFKVVLPNNNFERVSKINSKNTIYDDVLEFIATKEEVSRLEIEEKFECIRCVAYSETFKR